MKTTSTKVTITAATIIAIAGLSFGGPLNPPPGPVTSTMKTLTEVEPRIAINATNTPGDANSLYHISEPGSYYLTGNIDGVAGKHGIEISANNVTIDLNGFAVRGTSGALSGIVNANALSWATIRNGSISFWPNRGIAMTNALLASGVRLERLNVASCGVVCIEAGPQTTVESCSVMDSPNGVTVMDGSTVRNSTFGNINGQSIGVEDGSLVEGCTVRSAAGATGVALFGPATIRNCTITGGFVGISGDPRCVIEENTVVGTSNLGIWADVGCRVVGNTVADCQGIGIRLDGTHAVIAENTVNKIRGTGGNDIGIALLSGATRNSIHGNTISDCGQGVSIAAGGNAVYSNELTSNTMQFNVVAGNRVGPIVAGAASAAIAGSTGGAGMGSTDPFANILY
ncbi:MAG: NosD domain-containing protein [Phycisphaerales bacterium]